MREEDANVDLGNQFAPQIPPPPCNGDDHQIDKATLTPRSNFFPVAGAYAPLCDNHLNKSKICDRWTACGRRSSARARFAGCQAG